MVDKKAVVAIVVLVILVVALAGGLFMFLNQAELPDVNLAGVVEDVREAISGIFSGAEEEVLETPEPPRAVQEQAEPVEAIEAVALRFSEDVLFSAEQGVSTTAVRDGVVYFVSIPDDAPGGIDIWQFDIDEPDTLSHQSVEWEPGRQVQVFALSVTEAEYRVFLIDIAADGSERRFFYVGYDTLGELLFQHELPRNLFESVDNLSSITAAFTYAGVLVVQGIDGCDTRVAVMDGEGVFRGEFDPGCGRIGRARDGRIVFAESHEENLWELDLEHASLDIQLADSGVTGFVQATMLLQGAFDLYFNRNVDDVSHLYGYDMGTGASTRLFAWEEFGSAGEDRSFFPVVSLPDGRMVVRQRFNDRVQTDFILLTPEA